MKKENSVELELNTTSGLTQNVIIAMAKITQEQDRCTITLYCIKKASMELLTGNYPLEVKINIETEMNLNEIETILRNADIKVIYN